MQKKLNQILTLGLLLTVLLGFCGWSIVKPDEPVSASERRKLAQFPPLSSATVLSGAFMESFEAYSLDQFPLRDELRGLKAFTALKLLHQSDNNGLYSDRGYLSRLDFPLDTASVDNAAERFRRVYDLCLTDAGAIYAVIVPDKNYYTDASYPKMDYSALSERLLAAMPYAKPIDLTGQLTLESYYRTDPHWRQEALAPAAQYLAQQMGTQLSGSYETARLDTPFSGAYAGQYALPVAADDFSYLTNDTLASCRVYDYEAEAWKTLYDHDAAAGDDPYAFFLSGSRALLTVENPNASTDKELILFRDSYGSAIAPLLAEGYAKITLIDIRYLAPELLPRFVDFTGKDVLFLYSTTVLNSSNTLR